MLDRPCRIEQAVLRRSQRGDTTTRSQRNERKSCHVCKVPISRQVLRKRDFRNHGGRSMRALLVCRRGRSTLEELVGGIHDGDPAVVGDGEVCEGAQVVQAKIPGQVRCLCVGGAGSVAKATARLALQGRCDDSRLGHQTIVTSGFQRLLRKRRFSGTR